MSVYIKHRIAEGEHQQQDFKFEISDARKIARSFSAFSNTDGGRLLVGVKDNGAIAGVRSDEEYYMVEAAASLHCKPELSFEYTVWNMEGKTVFEVMVYKHKGELVKAPDKNGQYKVYLRRGDENILANGIFVLANQLKNQPKDIVLEYSNAERDLLDYLNKHQYVSFNHYRRTMQLGYHYARNMFVKLLALNVIQMDYDGKDYIYFLNNPG